MPSPVLYFIFLQRPSAKPVLLGAKMDHSRMREHGYTLEKLSEVKHDASTCPVHGLNKRQIEYRRKRGLHNHVQH